MDKQIHIYSVDTSAFYNDKEQKIHRILSKNYLFKNKIKKTIRKLERKHEENEKRIKKLNDYIDSTKRRIQKLKSRLQNEFRFNTGVRRLNPDALTRKKIISVFESSLTRTLGIQTNELSKDIIVVQTYFFEILKDIILNGFVYNDEKYVCFTASAGQIRTKKTVFIKEKIWLKHKNTLMCGLSIEKINEMGGVNINKFLAYLALGNSATDHWKEFDIDKVIVVDDMETTVRCLVDFIDEKTFEITRKEMDIEINHTDGCGMILPRKSKRSMMVRLPWIKGLLVSFPFDKFVREANKRNRTRYYGIVTDIYGKQYDLLKDNIEIILTKSQFKMWKYYSSWEEYKHYFKKYRCQAGKCNEEEDEIGEAKINYQMLQTLTDMTDEELEELTQKTRENILNIGENKDTMLRVLGVTKYNKNKNYLQQALELYPELLKDTYCKEVLKNVKKSIIKEARAGKIDIDGKYTFICPDLYAFCERLILEKENPVGLLKNGEVYCKLYKNEPKLDCLRSPHLYREHAIRTNVVDKEKSRWFVTNGLYTSIHDPISKVLMFDNDGDKSLVCADKTLLKVAERNMKGIVPLFYNMATANKELINNQSIFNGLRAAYSGGNIGVISNDITKIWNSEDVNLDVIKWLCAENNFVIDYAKTLYKVKRPRYASKQITKYVKRKVPYFFIYAKNKEIYEVEPKNKSTVNRLGDLIPNHRFSFKSSGLGKFDYKMLMNNPEVELDDKIIDLYKKLDSKSRFMINRNKGWTDDFSPKYYFVRQELLKLNGDINYVTDVLIQYLYGTKKENYKVTLWEALGDIIVKNLYENVKREIGDKIQCESCGIRIENTNNRQKHCEKCQTSRNRELTQIRVQKHRNSKKV